MKTKIAGVVVLYNPDIEVLDNIEGYYDKFDYLLLVDNSPLNNKASFERFISYSVEYCPLLNNFGIAYAINYAFNILADKGFEYIITLDQDSSFETNIVDVYKTFIERKSMYTIAALAPVYITDRVKVRNNLNEICKIKRSMQSGCLFSVNVWKVVGGFNEELFLDVVDYEYFYRLIKEKYVIYRVNSALLKHQPAVTKEIHIGPILLKYGIDSPERYYYQIRNILWIVSKYKSLYFFKGYIKKWSKILFLFPEKRKYIKFAIWGTADAIVGKLGPFDSKRLQKENGKY